MYEQSECIIGLTLNAVAESETRNMDDLGKWGQRVKAPGATLVIYMLLNFT